MANLPGRREIPARLAAIQLQMFGLVWQHRTRVYAIDPAHFHSRVTFGLPAAPHVTLQQPAMRSLAQRLSCFYGVLCVGLPGSAQVVMPLVRRCCCRIDPCFYI